uniref:Uncharacterized protein n=1 Tax=Plectus sambesii TaxID=2011161 RepID=A0A914WZF8_9BILA
MKPFNVVPSKVTKKNLVPHACCGVSMTDSKSQTGLLLTLTPQTLPEMTATGADAFTSVAVRRRVVWELVNTSSAFSVATPHVGVPPTDPLIHLT